MSVSQPTFAAALLDAEQAVPATLSDGQGNPAGKRYNVYRNNVAVSLTEALEKAFPVLCKLVGDTFFRAMAGVYLRAHPPSSPILAHYGAEMPTFLARFPPVAHMPYLGDIARIEQAVRRAYHAADAAPFTAEDLSQLSPDAFGDTVFQLSPAATLLRSPFPVGTIWQNNQPDAQSKPAKVPEDVLISRPGFDPMVDVLPTGAYAFFTALDGTAPLSTALEAAPEGFDFAQTLQVALARGLLILTIERPDP